MKFILLTILGLMIRSTFAYEFTSDFKSGIYWPSYPIPMNIYVDNTSGFTNLSQIITSSENEWESAIGQEIWNINYSGATSNGNVIRWSKNFSAETGFDPSTTLAVTIRTNDGTFFQKVEIILNGQNQVLVSNTNGVLKKTILHELGHTIGLDHSKEEAIMQPYISYLDRLTSDDTSGALSALDQNLNRKATGFRANLNSTDQKVEQNALACGSVDLNSSGGSSGPLSFLIGLGINFLFILLVGRIKWLRLRVPIKVL